MGIRSANGMGPAQPIPGYRTFRGSPARANAQAEIGRLIADLPPDSKELMRRQIASAWKSGKKPQEVYDMVYRALEAYREKENEVPSHSGF